MHLLHEDLARAHCRSRLSDAEQNRRFRLAQTVARAQKQAERATARAERASAKARLTLARLV
ncbi:hypothetical protein EV643_122105 [Kribbella sp. VKM Ac-2527]|uniref:Uncharacterized protein n=1 Tax=Kribbella caucasensis TaxID=2512215 RepID=A0A4R6JHW0_9ACTN|nr:hypothetical protein EV643_122105 [Kribbella sp. VKM Ac-2527]